MNKQLPSSVESSRLSRKVKDVGIAKELRPIPNEKLLSEWEIHESRSAIVDNVPLFPLREFGNDPSITLIALCRHYIDTEIGMMLATENRNMI